MYDDINIVDHDVDGFLDGGIEIVKDNSIGIDVHILNIKQPGDKSKGK